VSERSPDKPDKVEAIFELREAVEEKVHAEYSAAREGSPEARDALLDATLKVDEKTQDAIEVCHACDRPHATTEPHTTTEPRTASSRIGTHVDNVIAVDFTPESKQGDARS
jgi:hypothetical protein